MNSIRLFDKRQKISGRSRYMIGGDFEDPMHQTVYLIMESSDRYRLLLNLTVDDIDVACEFHADNNEKALEISNRLLSMF